MESQIKFPVRCVTDAQGEMGIVDATGKAVLWASETHTPAKGYVWHPEKKHVPHRFKCGTSHQHETTCYKERCELILLVTNLINNLKP